MGYITLPGRLFGSGAFQPVALVDLERCTAGAQAPGPPTRVSRGGVEVPPPAIEEPKLEPCDHRVRLDIATATAPTATTGSQATSDGQRVKRAPHNKAASA